jgi:exopolysaccharide biosynthesis polyprenyl glycosylphosphotransferase
MISQRSQGLYSVFSLVQICVCFVAFWAHLAIVNAFFSEILTSGNYIVYSILFVAGLAFEAVIRHESASDWYQKSAWSKNVLALRQCFFAAGPVLFFLVGAKDLIISRTFLFSYLGVLYATLLLTSIKLPRYLASLLFRQKHVERTLVVGSIPKASGLLHWLRQKTGLGIETIGLLSDDPDARYSSLPILGGTADLDRVVKEHMVSQVVLAEFPISADYLTQLTQKCEALGVRFLVRSDLEERFRHPIVYMENDGFHFIGLRQEPLENPFNRVLKRTVDIAISLPVVCFVLPVSCAIVWLFQRAQSPGPLFFRQHRSGFQRGQFRIIKFRTMHVNNPSESTQATKGDRRVFPAGRWLRSLSVDELPQFLNVLRGEMSVVGPRPHLPEHDNTFAKALQNYFIRSAVKPGITGLAQVQGFRGEATEASVIRGRIQCDIYYLENWSVLMDLWIIMRTAAQVVRPPPSAY